MKTRPMTNADIIAMLGAAGSRQVGDYINPLVDHIEGDAHAGYYREVLRVVARKEGDLGAYEYECVDALGRAWTVYRAGDPRPADHEQIAWFEAGKLEQDRPS